MRHIFFFNPIWVSLSHPQFVFVILCLIFFYFLFLSYANKLQTFKTFFAFFAFLNCIVKYFFRRAQTSIKANRLIFHDLQAQLYIQYMSGYISKTNYVEIWLCLIISAVYLLCTSKLLIFHITRKHLIIMYICITSWTWRIKDQNDTWLKSTNTNFIVNIVACSH